MFIMEFTPDRRQSKSLILSANVEQNSLNRVFLLSFAASHSKTLFLAIFDLRSSIVKDAFDFRISGVD